MSFTRRPHIAGGQRYGTEHRPWLRAAIVLGKALALTVALLALAVIAG